MAHILLRDPHSPVYARSWRKPKEKEKIKDRINGVRQIFLKGMWPYRTGSDLRVAIPEVMTPGLRPKEGEKEKKVWPAVVIGAAIPSLAALFKRRAYKPEDFVTAAIGGGTEIAVQAGLTIAGGMAVNSLGHAGGELTTRKILHAIFGRSYKPMLNPDGSVAADTTDAGWLGKLVHFLTADEVGKQRHHHDRPGDIIYSLRTGIKGILDAPVGSAIDAIAMSRLPLIQRGDNFGGLAPDDPSRPDMPHPATVLIMERRKQQYPIDQERARLKLAA